MPDKCLNLRHHFIVSVDRTLFQHIHNNCYRTIQIAEIICSDNRGGTSSDISERHEIIKYIAVRTIIPYLTHHFKIVFEYCYIAYPIVVRYVDFQTYFLYCLIQVYNAPESHVLYRFPSRGIFVLLV